MTKVKVGRDVGTLELPCTLGVNRVLATNHGSLPDLCLTLLYNPDLFQHSNPYFENVTKMGIPVKAFETIMLSNLGKHNIVH